MDGDEEMYDEDGDEMMEDNRNKNKDKSRRGGNRLSDQVEMDDEPALQGYERYVLSSKDRLVRNGCLSVRFRLLHISYRVTLQD